MKPFARLLSLLLIFSLAWTPVALHAEMISTDRVATTPAAGHDADSVARFLQRPEVTAQLESMGLPTQTAQERVAAMTPAEVNELAGQIDSLPAGADSTLSLAGSTWLIVAIIALVAFIIWAKYRPTAR